jgi:hypothetical protein
MPDGKLLTVAGQLNQGLGGDGGPATQALLASPAGLAFDRAGNLYIADRFNSRIRKVAPNDDITTIAGGLAAPNFGDGGPAIQAQLSGPSALAFDQTGNLLIADTGTSRIRKIAPNGIITAVALWRRPSRQRFSSQFRQRPGRPRLDPGGLWRTFGRSDVGGERLALAVGVGRHARIRARQRGSRTRRAALFRRASADQLPAARQHSQRPGHTDDFQSQRRSFDRRTAGDAHRARFVRGQRQRPGRRRCHRAARQSQRHAGFEPIAQFDPTRNRFVP